MKLHILKIKEEYYRDAIADEKTFELRKNDRDYKVGDLIHFVDVNGYDFGYYKDNVFRIEYILKDGLEYGLDKDYCIFRGVRVMSLEEIINLLKISGKNTKRQVVDMLENATIEQLQELRKSIDEKINIKKI